MIEGLDKNAKGEYALYDQGKLIGYAAIDYIDGKKVLAKYKQLVNDLKAAAAKDNVVLTLNSGFRTHGEQYELRKRYRKAFEDNLLKQKKSFETKLNDEKFLLEASPGEFFPRVAKPGYSNHQDGTAFDFMVRDDPNTKANEALAYAWLVKNAINFGFIREVSSERWHWVHRPGAGKFSIVKETDPSWDGLV